TINGEADVEFVFAQRALYSSFPVASANRVQGLAGFVETVGLRFMDGRVAEIGRPGSPDSILNGHVGGREIVVRVLAPGLACDAPRPVEHLPVLPELVAAPAKAGRHTKRLQQR